jgi:nicotinamidase-related amidase
MSAARLLDRARAVLVVVDVQEAFRGAVHEFEAIARAAGRLVSGARLLDVPIVVTEQYPQGLGPTVDEIGLDGERPLAKTVFAASRAKGFDLGGRDQVLLCGIEAHVCVSQTAHDLLDDGVEVHVAADATSSRKPSDRDIGVRKMERSGAIVTSVETALLELCEEAGTREFKAVQGLIK